MARLQRQIDVRSSSRPPPRRSAAWPGGPLRVATPVMRPAQAGVNRGPETELDLASKFSLLTVEKGQGLSLPGYADDKMAAIAGRRHTHSMFGDSMFGDSVDLC